MQVKITFTNETRSGTSAKGNAWMFQEGFIHVEDKPFPLQAQLFVKSAVRPGDYLVPVSIGVEQGRPTLVLNLDGMKAVS